VRPSELLEESGCELEVLDALDRETRVPDRLLCVACDVAAAAELRPDRLNRHLRRRVQAPVGSHVLEEAQLAGGTDDPHELAERRLLVVDRAQYERGDGSVELAVGRGQRLGEAGQDPHGAPRFGGSSVSALEQILLRLDRDELGDGLRVEPEVRAVAAAELEHPAAEPVEQPLSVAVLAVLLRGLAEARIENVCE
jgi:hypothetical protein